MSSASGVEEDLETDLSKSSMAVSGYGVYMYVIDFAECPQNPHRLPN